MPIRVKKEPRYSLEYCIEFCLQFATRKELKAAPNGAAIYQHIVDNGWRRECFAHMHRSGSANTDPAPIIDYKKNRNIYDLIEVCRKYSTEKEFRNSDYVTWHYIKYHHCEDLCFADFEPDPEPAYKTKPKGDGSRGRYADKYFTDPPALDGDTLLRTYKFRIPHNEVLDHYMRVANNLYNQTVYEFRTAFDNEEDKQWLNAIALRDRMKSTVNLENNINYNLMPNDAMADRVIADVAAACQAFATQMRNHKPGQPFPHPPGYKRPGGMHILRKGGSKVSINKKGIMGLANDIHIHIPEFEKYKALIRYVRWVTLIPRSSYIEVAIAYDVDHRPDPEVDESEYAAIDIGVDNMLTMVDRFQTTIYSGRFLKSYNQYFNDQMRHLRRAAHWQKGMPYTKRMQKLQDDRTGYVNDVMHKVSRHLVDYLQSQHIGVLIIGWDGSIKQRSKLGRNEERMFLLIPHGKLIDMITYKCEAVGIHVVLTEESHTSKCDALALEPIEHHDEYMGKRVKRGLYRSSTGRLINADVNGAINIMRKVIGDCSFVKEVISKGHLFHPVGYDHPFGWGRPQE